MAEHVINIERDTRANEDYRRVLFTGESPQLVLMTFTPREEIGSDTHAGHDQLIRVESGLGNRASGSHGASNQDGRIAPPKS